MAMSQFYGYGLVVERFGCFSSSNSPLRGQDWAVVSVFRRPHLLFAFFFSSLSNRLKVGTSIVNEEWIAWIAGGGPLGHASRLVLASIYKFPSIGARFFLLLNDWPSLRQEYSKHPHRFFLIFLCFVLSLSFFPPCSPILTVSPWNGHAPWKTIFWIVLKTVF